MRYYYRMQHYCIYCSNWTSSIVVTHRRVLISVVPSLVFHFYSFLLLTVGKSLDDGNNLYKACDFANASKVYERALKHVGELSPTPVNHSIPLKMADICAHLLLGYSRCQRKLGDLPLGMYLLVNRISFDLFTFASFVNYSDNTDNGGPFPTPSSFLLL